MAMTSQTEGRAGGGLGAGPSPPGVPRALGACARTGRHESRSVPRARPRLGPPPRGAGSSDAGSDRRLRARPKRHNIGSPSRRATVSPALSAQSTTTASWPGSRSRPDRSDRSDHARRDGGTRTRPRRTRDGRREDDLRDDQAHLRRSIWASRMRPTCGLVIGAPSVPDWATSNGLARPPLSVRSSRVRARPASLAAAVLQAGRARRPPKRGLRGRARPGPALWIVTPTANTLVAMRGVWQRVGRRTWCSNPRGRPRFPVSRVHGKPDVPCVDAWGRVRLHVENGVAAPTRVQTFPKGALIMVISTRFSIGTDGYEESND